MNRDQIIEALNLGDTHTVEFRQGCTNLNSLGNAVCAFLNTAGGYIICGVHESGEIIGVEHADAQAQKIETALLHFLSPKAPVFVLTQNFGEKNLIVIEVPSGKDVPYAYRNNIYIRDGQTVHKADVDTIRDMILRKQIAPERWERLFSLADLHTDLSEEELRAFILTAGNKLRGRLQDHDDPITLLETLSLVKYGRLTNGGDVLFGRNPALRYPQIRVQAVRFVSDQTDDTYLDMKTYEGPLVSTLEDLFMFIQRNTPMISRFVRDQLNRQDQSIYPSDAIREGLVNAFAHRDYADFSGSIVVKIYKTRLEITNSGRFPEGITPNLLAKGHISVLRNPDIAHVMYLQGLMEKLGRGSLLIQQICAAQGLPPPLWREDPSGVTLTLYAPDTFVDSQSTGDSAYRGTPEVTPEVTRLLRVMQGERSRRDLQNLMMLKDEEHFRKAYLLPAMHAGLIEMTYPDKPHSRNQKYRLTEKGKMVQVLR